MPEGVQKQLAKEAARIFVRLEEDPEDARAIADRVAFLARGEVEREVWSHVLKVWSGTRKRRAPPAPLGFVLILVLGASAYLAAKPLSIYFKADFATRYQNDDVVLASGDRATLDADTALVDDTSGGLRRVEVLKGAAFFDVSPDDKAFEVTLGDLRVEVLGTSLETALIGDEAVISVAEGIVNVHDGLQSWMLEAGDRLTQSGESVVQLSEVSISEVADWRDDLFLADGMTFAQVADVIDRRLPGRIAIFDESLAQTKVGGPIDLTDPLLALRTLAVATDARMTHAPGVATFFWPR